jgi:hypothetical protein
MVEPEKESSQEDLVSSADVPGEEGIINLERELHTLDVSMNKLRQRIFLVAHNIVETPDRDAELTRLRAEFDREGDRFVEVYRRWNNSSED